MRVGVNSRVPPERYPWWVRVGRLGARGRTAQWFWVWASVVLGVSLIALGITWSGATLVDLIVRGSLLISGLWGFVAGFIYWSIIRWVDRNGSWDD